MTTTSRELAPPVATGEPARETLPFDRNPAAVYVASLASPESRRSARSSLVALAKAIHADATPEEVPWHRLRRQHVQALWARLLARPLAPATFGRLRAVLRGVLRESWRLGWMDADEHAHARDIPTVRGSRLPAGRALEDGEVLTLFANCDDTPGGTRLRAILVLLFGAGLRRSEAVSLQVGDCDGMGRTVRVVGKGNKERRVPLPRGAWLHLEPWMSMRGGAPGPLLVRLRKNGAVDPQLRALSAGGLYLALRAHAAKVGCAFSPHDGRRTRLTSLLDEGVDLAQVQRFAGHARVDTTAKYDRRPAQRLAAAVERAGFAGQGDAGHGTNQGKNRPSSK